MNHQLNRALLFLLGFLAVFGTFLLAYDAPSEDGNISPRVGSSMDPVTVEIGSVVVNMSTGEIGDNSARLHLNSPQIGVAYLRDSDDSAKKEVLIPLREWGHALGLGVTWRGKPSYEGDAAPLFYVGGKTVPRVFQQLEVSGWKGYGELGDLMKMAQLFSVETIADGAHVVVLVTRYPEGK